ncbi:EAL domain-containing protein [Lederbergia citri]|uniref:EAL domain-containing protein n=1 Tax=Lederbergia citri TaxID=2833580 RepID=A0A942TIN6_9BACI|nr:EAL domain-containing protein [Lederbergia citri]MBS4197758.1 EAL domain-containing protein [Lederbergia citri]
MKNEDKINILLVDDRPENLLALEAIIERDDYNLVKASSGEEALKYLLKYDFAAILLDVQMPGMDGFGTAKIIKAREKTKNIPILFITANNMDTEHIFMGYSLGAIDYILKPFDPIILKAKVEGFVEIYKLKQTLIHQANALEEKNKVIEYMAFHDGLTDLPNRRMFNDQLLFKLNHAKRMKQTLGIMYLDLDRFKYVNDSLGHIVGDRLLKEVSKRLSASVREKDLVSRVGGDEFNIILVDTDREKALEVAENIVERLSQRFIIDQYEIFITTCIGLSVFPYDGEDSNTLMKNADVALHRAKEQGKNKFKVYHSGMNMQSYRTFLMQNDLRKAIENEELELVFQPRVNIKSGKITSAESLLRWNHPSWGAISPSEFIPIAEETDQIVEIGKWVLQKVCEQIQIWNKKDLNPIRIAINFSARQFLQKNLIEHIQQVLTETNINPELLEIEITESVLLGNEDVITSTLQQLRKMGIKISLDDFGTGYSSLNYLRRFPFDTIKIDKSFIDDILNHQNNSKAVIQFMISLANSINMSVIAEGIETEEQLKEINNLNCDEVQGYLLSPPLLSSDFEKFFVNRSKNPFVFREEDRTKMTTVHLSENTDINDDKKFKKDVLDVALTYIKKSYSISSREMEVFELIMDGLTNKEISEQLFISEHTVKNHITRIFQKLNVTDRVQAIALVYETFMNEGNTLFN